MIKLELEEIKSKKFPIPILILEKKQKKLKKLENASFYLSPQFSKKLICVFDMPNLKMSNCK